jgi:spore photoproduct lyase
VAELLTLDHQRRTRVRFSVNAPEIARRFDGGTAPLAARLAALRAMALAGYRVGLTIAPVMAYGDDSGPGWREGYGDLLDQVGEAVAGVPDLDLTTEIITHRFTPASKDVLLGWYPHTKLEMDEDVRTQKRSKFGGVKYVYPRATMTEMRTWFTDELSRRLPASPLLYWT